MSDDEQYDEPREYEDDEPRDDEEAPQEDEPAPQEDEPQDYQQEEPQEDYHQEEPQEEAKDEPAEKPYEAPAEEPSPEDDGAALSVEDLWKTLSKDKPPFNWYLCTVEGKNPALKPFKRGSGGLQEIRQVLSSNQSQILLGLLRVNSNDKGGSTRAKFVYIRFVGGSVPVMQKAKLTPQLGKMGDSFPVKHLTLDLDDDLTGFSGDSLTKEFLRVGGAHKPDSYSYGPNQVFNVK